MTWIDLLTIALFVLVGFLEAKRGAVPAAIDLVIGLLGIGMAKMWAPGLAGSVGSHATAFVILLVVVVIVAAVTSSLADAYTKWDIGPYDSAVAGVLGAICGLAIAHGVYHAAFAAGGGMEQVAQRSLLACEVYDLRTAHAIGGMLRNLGGGGRIVDDVKESQK